MGSFPSASDCSYVAYEITQLPATVRVARNEHANLTEPGGRCRSPPFRLGRHHRRAASLPPERSVARTGRPTGGSGRGSSRTPSVPSPSWLRAKPRTATSALLYVEAGHEHLRGGAKAPHMHPRPQRNCRSPASGGPQAMLTHYRVGDGTRHSNRKHAEWTVMSDSIKTNSRQVPRHALSVSQLIR